MAAAASAVATKVGRAFFHLAAGVLGREDLDRMTRLVWDAFLVEDGDALSGLFAWERELYRPIVRPGDRLLMVGCGSGRDMLPFLDQGHAIVGVEPAPAPVAKLRRLLHARGQSAEIIEGFVADTPLPGEFDVIIFSWLCYSYMRESSRRIAALRHVASSLHRDGRIVISYLAADPSPHSRVMSLTSFVARVTGSDWTPEPNDVLGQRTGGRGERLVYYEHWFTDDEIADEVSRAGLRILTRLTPAGVPALVLGL